MIKPPETTAIESFIELFAKFIFDLSEYNIPRN